MLKVKSNNTWLDGRKLKANIFKFKRKDINFQGATVLGKMKEGGAYEVRGKEGNVKVVTSGPSRVIGGPDTLKGFAEVVRGK